MELKTSNTVITTLSPPPIYFDTAPVPRLADPKLRRWRLLRDLLPPDPAPAGRFRFWTRKPPTPAPHKPVMPSFTLAEDDEDTGTPHLSPARSVWVPEGDPLRSRYKQTPPGAAARLPRRPAA